MIAIRVSVTDDELRNLLARWLVKSRKPIQEALVTVARTTCKAFMDYTLPSEPTKLERTVDMDVRRAYATKNKVFADIRKVNLNAARGFWSLFESGKYLKAKKIMDAVSPKYSGLSIQSFDGGAAHMAARGERGRVPKSTQPAFVIKQTGKTNKLIRYIEKKKANVGTAKAGWVAAWRDLGRVREVPNWVRRAEKTSGGKLGSADKQFTGKTSQHILIHNHAIHTSDAFMEKHRTRIQAIADENLAIFLKLQLKDIVP